MDLEKLPDIKGKTLSARISFACEPELEAKLRQLKVTHNKDVAEWLRRVVRRELAGVFGEDKKVA
jgi:hypothetical protein